MTLTEYFVILEAVVFFIIAYLQQQRISKLEKLEEYFQQHVQDCHKPQRGCE